MEILKNATFIRNTIISLIVALSLSAAFGLGRMSILMGEKEPISIENYAPAVATSSAVSEAPPPEIKKAAAPQSQTTKTPNISAKTPLPSAPANETFIASKTGKSYYFPWCGIVKRIKKENQITFSSRAAAEAAGYKPGNCAGLK